MRLAPLVLLPLAVEAVKHWEFVPAELEDKPVPAPLLVQVDFRLE